MSFLHGVTAKVADFDHRNGGDPAYLNGFLYFANGAVREADPLGPLIEPPGNEFERLKNVVKYHEARLTRAVKDFDAAKEHLMVFSCSDKKAAMDGLRKLQDIVGQRNQELEQAKARLASTPEGKRIEEGRQWQLRDQQALADFRRQIAAMKV